MSKNKLTLIRNNNLDLINFRENDFLKAYVLYRNYNYKKSLKVLNTLKETLRVKLLKAQNFYFLSRFKEAFKVYDSITLKDEELLFNKNLLIYIMRNEQPFIPKCKYFFKNVEDEYLCDPTKKFSTQTLCIENEFNSTFQFLNGPENFNRFLNNNLHNKLISNQVKNLESDFEFLEDNKTTEFNKNKTEFKRPRLFQNTELFDAFRLRKNIKKRAECNLILGAYLDFKAGRPFKNNLPDSIWKIVFEVLNDEKIGNFKNLYKRLLKF